VPIRFIMATESAPSEYQNLVPVAINSFIGGKIAHVDLFIKISEDKFIRVVKKGDAFDLERLKNYSSHRVEFVYIDKSAFGSHVETSVSIANIAIKKTSVPQGARVKMLTSAADAVFHELSRMDFNEDCFEHAKKICGSMIGVVGVDHDVGKIILELTELNSDFAKHSVGVSIIATMIANALAWKGAKTMNLISMGGLLHDIGFKNLPPELMEMKKSDMSPEEIKLYESHPIKAITLLRDFSEVPQEVVAIIGEHHEIPNGLGFPRGIKTDRIYPLSRCVALADQLVHLILITKNNPNPKSLREAILYLEHSVHHDFQSIFWEALYKIAGDKNFAMAKEKDKKRA